MEPTLLGWVVSLTGPDATGSELFLAAVHQVSFMTAALVRSVCNKMGALKLKAITGEKVGDSCEIISEMIKQIENSGKLPSDLLNLVSTPFATGTQETFKIFAQQVCTEIIIARKFSGDENKCDPQDEQLSSSAFTEQ